MKLTLRIGTIRDDRAFVRIYRDGEPVGEALMDRAVIEELGDVPDEFPPPLFEGDHLDLKVKLRHRWR